MVVQPNDATWWKGLSGALEGSDISLVKPTSNPCCKRVQLGVTYNSVGPDAICIYMLSRNQTEGGQGETPSCPHPVRLL